MPASILALFPVPLVHVLPKVTNSFLLSIFSFLYILLLSMRKLRAYPMLQIECNTTGRVTTLGSSRFNPLVRCTSSGFRRQRPPTRTATSRMVTTTGGEGMPAADTGMTPGKGQGGNRATTEVIEEPAECSMDELVGLCKRRGFVFQSSEVCPKSRVSDHECASRLACGRKSQNSLHALESSLMSSRGVSHSRRIRWKEALNSDKCSACKKPFNSLYNSSAS